jgi:hypothetical protein
MLRVTIELVPFGDESRARKIATMLIANDGTGDHRTGNYGYAFQYDDRSNDVATGVIKNFPRASGAWSLVKRILNNNSFQITELTDVLKERL